MQFARSFRFRVSGAREIAMRLRNNNRECRDDDFLRAHDALCIRQGSASYSHVSKSIGRDVVVEIELLV